MSKKKQIGLQNRLEIVVQSLLDYGEEGGSVTFDVVEGRLVVVLDGVGEEDGHMVVQATDRGEQSDTPVAAAVTLDDAVRDRTELSRAAVAPAAETREHGPDQTNAPSEMFNPAL